MPNFYWDKRAMEEDGVYQPTILALGDSWFWYPMLGGSLLNYLGAILKPFGHTIYARGMNGAEAFDLVDGAYAKQVQVALKLYGLTPGGPGVHAVFVSAGGNDFAGFSDLRPLLHDDCSQFGEAADCFSGLREFFDDVELHYRKLIGLLYASTRPECKIVMHSYDYALPTGKGIFGSGSWLKQALDDAKVDPLLQAACIEHLLTKFNERLTNVSQADPDRLFVVDSRGTLEPEDWANELHPTGSGFRKIAEKCWVPVLIRAGLMSAG
jgi:hypothetical protein